MSADKSDDDLDQLDQLLRELLTLEMGRFVRPSEDAVLAYIQGRASQEQEQEVQSALVTSPPYREEFFGLLHDIVALENPRLAVNHTVATTEAQLSSRITRLLRQAANLIWRRQSKRGTVVARLGVAMAVALVAFALWPRHSAYVARSFENVTMVSPETFGQIPAKQRALTERPRSNLLSEEETARITFLNSIRIVEGYFRFEPEIKTEVPPPLPRVVTLRFSLGSGASLLDCSAHVPNRPVKVSAWLLSLPSGRLQKLNIDVDRIKIETIPEGDQLAAVLFTYPTESGFVATAPMEIR